MPWARDRRVSPLTGLGSFWQPTQTCRSGLTHFAPTALDHVVLITMEGAIFGDVAVLRLYVEILERRRAFAPLTPAKRLKMGQPAAERGTVLKEKLRHNDLLLQFRCEQVFGNHGVHSANNIHDLGDAEAACDAQKRVSIEFGQPGT